MSRGFVVSEMYRKREFRLNTKKRVSIGSKPGSDAGLYGLVGLRLCTLHADCARDARARAHAK